MTRKLTTDEVAERYRTSPSTVRYWRMAGTGPKGTRVGRRVLYDEQDCLAWETELSRAEHGGDAA